jgi:hypothetical protein
MAISGDEYRAKAARIEELAKSEANIRLRADFERIAQSYRQFAGHADKKAVLVGCAEVSNIVGAPW